MNDNEYLIQAFLAEFKEDDCEIQNYDELIIEEDSKADDTRDLIARHPETSYDWDNLNDVEEEENSVEANRVLSSFIETVSYDERTEELETLFEKEFPVGKSFLEKADARFQIQKLIGPITSHSKLLEAMQSMLRWYVSILALILLGEKMMKVKLHNFVPEFGLRFEAFLSFLEKEEDNDKSFIKRPSRTTVDNKSPGNSWTINSNCFAHNHPISEDERLYSVNKSWMPRIKS
ncbi:hypothetical protein BDF21DRAFT_400101 [Thamnidium elegans]|nr:hypothetical protein BDF21DRAFT_400101 [Thamnidium elegans]